MIDNQDRLRHDIVAQHASVQRKKARSSQAFVVSSPVVADASTSGAHASPPLSSRRRHMSPTQAPEAPQAPEGFGEGPSDLSLLPLYQDHIVEHV